MASDDEEVYTPLWCPSIQDYYLCPWLHRLDDGTIAVAWVSAAEWTHRDQHRVEYGGLTPCSDPSEPPADELLAIESDADETSGGNDADDAGPDVTGDGKGKHDGELDGEAEVKPTSAIGARSAGARATRDDVPRFGIMCLYVDLPIAIHKRYHAGTHKGRKRRRTT